ncbi:hypothetical protein [Brachybacterium sp.]|uniref:hypothetical protein n=1 Tax=Brachybacterium sp. TaxID=1891286 RepID=UPI002ED3F041
MTRQDTSREPRRRPARPLAALGALLALSGCYLLEPDPLPRGTEDVTIEAGETVQVDLGSWSPGVGDDWGVLPQAQEGTLEARVVMNSEVFGVRERRDRPEAGGELPYAVELTGLAPGTSTVRIQYCYRTAITEDCEQRPHEDRVAPLEIDVTVE